MADHTKNIPSSFVTEEFIVRGESGSGEAKFHLGPRSKATEFDTYFDFGGTAGLTFQFDRDNLLAYLNEAKVEYATNSLQRYNAVDLSKWNAAIDYVNSVTEWRFELTKHVDANRYYIRPNDASTTYPDGSVLWDNCLRKLPLPKITNLEIDKDGGIVTFKIFIDYTRLTRLPVPTFNFVTSYECNDYPLNRLVFGAPGTGKSFMLDEQANDILPSPKFYERVTFYPDYSYSKFVGTYKPVSIKGKVEYKFVPGPFMNILIMALKESMTPDPKPCLLIVDEINRAIPAAVFGDIFQLLDRDETGASQYTITPTEEMKDYLISIFGGSPDDYDDFKIPNNMLIWATMNSADQGVNTLDTAFKRRWEYEYVGINKNEDKIKGKVTLGTGADSLEIDWNKLRKAINNKLSAEYKVNEDKLMGPFFMSKSLLKTVSDTDDTVVDQEAFKKAFKSKVIMYLYDDAAKPHKGKLFAGCSDTTKYSSVCDDFDTKGIKIFGDEFKTKYYDVL